MFMIATRCWPRVARVSIRCDWCDCSDQSLLFQYLNLGLTRVGDAQTKIEEILAARRHRDTGKIHLRYPSEFIGPLQYKLL